MERFAQPLLSESQRLLLLEARPACASFPRGAFVSVQLMEEDGEDSAPRRICGPALAVRVEKLRAYGRFADLAYNPLWEGNLKGRGEEAAQLLVVTIPEAVGRPPASG